MSLETEISKVGKVLVVGGGIAGIQAALDIAELGYYVYLAERSPSLGGNMAQLDKTFPTNDCATCMFSPKMVEVVSCPNVEIFTLAEVEKVRGSAGNFEVLLKVMPRYINIQKCISCGICSEKCPKKVPDEFNQYLSFRKAAYLPFPQATPRAYVIDPQNCIYLLKGKCRACEKFCPRKAVEFDQKEEKLVLNVGAIVLAPGYELTISEKDQEMGFNRYQNVITSLQYERILSATGPTSGHIVRPSDRRTPKSIAWIQCVLSRNPSLNRPYCSSVCCMHAVKQATLTKFHDPNIETTIYFMDIRAHGKGFDQFVERARYQFGVKFRRSMISQLYLNPSNQNLIIETFDTEINQKIQHEVELVVLSSGIRPKEDFIQLSKRMGLVLDRYGFVGSHEFEPISTNREGIYVCGMARGPKDIPDTVIESSAAALEVSWFLKEERGKLVKELKGPEGKEIAPEPRTGVFICHCGSNIAGVLDIEELVDFAKGLDGVVVAKNFMFTCATDTQEVLKELIEEHRLNRVVVAACSPRTHEPLFRATLKRAGLNPYLLEMANIRDQCSWVHGSSPQEALRKAKQLIRGAVFKASLLEPLEEHKFSVSKEALVVGGGVSGLVAALSLADQGFGVHLVEITDELGGIAKGIVETLKGHSPLNYAKMLSRQVLGHPNIKVYLNSRLVEHKGHVGSFEGVILSKDKRFSIKYGAVIVATGGIPYQPTEYLYGEDNRVLTQFELQDLLRKEPDTVKGINSVLMIQCVGSRNEEFPQCSRVCCGTAVKNALRLKDIKPSLQVIVLYRDLRTYGSNELYYLKARKAGVLFFRYIQENPPRVETEGGSLVVTFLDRGSRERFLVRPDMVVLSAGVRPNPHSQELSEVLKLPKNQVGLFQEAHIKLRPVEFSTPGIFLAGMAHSPRFVEECIIMAKAAAAQASKILCQDELTTPATVAVVDPDKCAACLICVRVCPFGAPFINNEGVSEIRPSMCMGCGICVSECPAKAIDLLHCKDVQIHSQLSGILSGVSIP